MPTLPCFLSLCVVSIVGALAAVAWIATAKAIVAAPDPLADDDPFSPE